MNRGFTLLELLVVLAVLALWTLGIEYAKSMGSTPIVLSADEWKCARTGTRDADRLVGRIMTRQQETICFEYRRRDAE